MSTETPHSSGPEILPEGFVVAGRYRIRSLLGKGGMGCVYRAADAVLGDEEIAIKILHPDFIHDEELMQRFLREVQLMRRVSHQNVVRTYDVGSDGNLAYFTMEYVPGQSLEPLIRDQAIPRSQVASLVVQIADALEAIHQAGIVHRDLKPGNVLLLNDGTVRITDFGVARPEVSEMTAHNEILGSVCYIAPEIWLGKDPGPSVDLYSLGIILYEIATGDVPFDGGSPPELMRLHLDRLPTPPKEINSATPPWLNSVIMRLLEKDPKDRFLTAKELSTHVSLHLEDGSTRKENARQDASSFLDSLEQKSQVLESVSPSVQKAPASAPTRAAKKRKPQGSLPRNARNVASSQNSLRLRALQIGRAVFFSLVLLGAWSLFGQLLGVLFATPGILRSVVAAGFLIFGLSILCFVLTLSCKAWKLLLRNTLLGALFSSAMFGLFTTLAYFSAPIAEVESATRISYSLARASEQLLSLTTLQAVVALAEDPASSARLLPLTSVGVSLVASMLLLVFLGFLLNSILRNQSRASLKASLLSMAAVALLLIVESLFIEASAAESFLSFGIVATALPGSALLVGAIHWMLIFVVAILLSTRKVRGKR